MSSRARALAGSLPAEQPWALGASGVTGLDGMQRRQALIVFSFLTLLWAPAVVRADQPRDWMVGPQPGGTLLNLDLIFPGVQAQVEHRVPIYGIANELWFKANALLTLPFYESQFDVDLRLVALSLGGSVGYRDDFRTYEFAPGESISRGHRRARESAGDYTNTSNGFGEGRVTLALPFNDNVVFLSINGLRYEGGTDRTFDWRIGVVRDSGTYLNSNNTLFFKSHKYGSIGPQLQVLNFRLDGKRETQVNYGFTVVTRPGFMHKNDVLFLSMLFNFNHSSTGYDAGGSFGNHTFYGPYTFQLAYRMVFELQPKGLPWKDDE